MCPGLRKGSTAAAMDAEALHKTSRFFDSLVDLVPAKYYLDSGEEKVRAQADFPPPSPLPPPLPPLGAASPSPPLKQLCAWLLPRSTSST